ncbi:hypothetical protein PGB90_002032 [Kerria lacca]
MLRVENHDDFLFSRYSSLNKLVRIVSVVYRWCHRSPTFAKRLELSKKSFYSLFVLCRLSQLVCFKSEISAIMNGEELDHRSSLSALNPYLDKMGVLRVGGRLKNANLSYDAKHPIILHRKSKLVDLLVHHVHENYFHASRSFVVGYIQVRYWILGGLSQLEKKVRYKCVWCTRMKGETCRQIMGDLPAERTLASRPFAYVGIDFVGPFTIKCTRHRTMKYAKHYVAFFICLVIRAVHLELVSDLSTSAFIAAFQRFTARRGIPNTLWTDNATNFVGTNNQFAQYYHSLGITWKFIPPRSPHQGGIWEAAVKAGKKYLLSATKGQIFTSEQLMTTLCQVEAILNSRPMYRKHLGSTLDAIDIITPGHFLISSNVLDTAQPEAFNISLSERLEHQRVIIRSFWRQWKSNYLAQLQSRSKWKQDSPNIVVGDVVLLKSETPPSQWPLAVVTDVILDTNGKVRLVWIKTKDSMLQRTVQNLVKLPVDHNN